VLVILHFDVVDLLSRQLVKYRLHNLGPMLFAVHSQILSHRLSQVFTPAAFNVAAYCLLPTPAVANASVD